MCVCVCVSQRRDIVTGTVEPTDEECEWQSDREEEELAVSAAAFFFLSLWICTANVNSAKLLTKKRVTQAYSP